MSIERLNLKDPATAEEVWSMQHAAYRHEAALIGVPDLPPLQDTVHSLQQSGETFYGFRTEDGELAGAVSVSEKPGGRIEVYRMMVRPEYFRQGIASRLLQHLAGQAPAGSELSVTAEIRNQPAIRLYERNGFRSAGTINPAPNITMIEFVRPIL